MASCFVATEDATGLLAGSYTLSSAGVNAEELPPDVTKKLPRYKALPVALVGRLAVDKRFHGMRLGSSLLADAALRALRSEVRAFAVLVDAKDDEAAAFYARMGFRPLPPRPLTLFLPLSTLEVAANSV